MIGQDQTGQPSAMPDSRTESNITSTATGAPMF